jgi:predicted metal-dependent phosphoesterase TrpH
MHSSTASLSTICITDHLKSGYACAAAHAAKKRDDITVFPGVEASVVGG